MTEYITEDAPLARTGAIRLHGEEGFAGMRAAGRLAAETLDMIAPHVVPGVTTAALDDMIILRRGNRLSITPVTAEEWDCINALLEGGARA